MRSSIDETCDIDLPQLVEKYRRLQSNRKLNVLESLIHASDSELLVHLYSDILPIYIYKDFILDLPLELATKVLSYLDGCDLIKCCKVSRAWNSKISSCISLWKDVCDLCGTYLSSMRCHLGELVDYIDGDKMTHLRDVPANYQCLKYYSLAESDISAARQPESFNCYKTIFCDFLTLIQSFKRQSYPDIVYMRGHQVTVTCCYQFGGLLVTGDSTGIVRFWDIKTENCVRMLDCNMSISCLTFDCSLLIVGFFNGALKSWNRITHDLHISFDGDYSAIKSVEMNRTHSPIVISISFEYVIKLWSCCSGHCLFMSNNLSQESFSNLPLRIFVDVKKDVIFVIALYAQKNNNVSLYKIVRHNEKFQDYAESTIRNPTNSLCLWTGSCFQLLLYNCTVCIKDRTKILWSYELSDYSGLRAARWPILCFGGNHFLDGFYGSQSAHDMFLVTSHGSDVVLLKFKF